jgi:hypothetical protein
MNFERIYNDCKPLLSFKEIYLECNEKQPLFEMNVGNASLISMPFILAPTIGKGSLCHYLYQWLCKNDNKSIIECLKDYTSYQFTGEDKIKPAIYKIKDKTYTELPNGIDKKKVKTQIIETKPNSGERRLWTEKLIEILKNSPYLKDLTEDHYTEISNFFFNIEENQPQKHGFN